MKFGFHNVTGYAGKKESLAVDMLDDDHASNEGRIYLFHLAAAAESHGLMTGIRFGVPVELRPLIDQAISSKKWNAQVKIGWDPTHIQPANFTIAQAEQGEFPNYV